jgi:hypothetical protein
VVSRWFLINRFAASPFDRKLVAADGTVHRQVLRQPARAGREDPGRLAFAQEAARPGAARGRLLQRAPVGAAISTRFISLTS